jgi:hypothetical protein
MFIENKRNLTPNGSHIPKSIPYASGTSEKRKAVKQV